MPQEWASRERLQRGLNSWRPGRPVALVWKIEQPERESRGRWKKKKKLRQRAWAQLWAVVY